ncbi:MAG: ExeM/NucH family extracellular endonuclease, partial [Lysobacterales bacterium]
MSRKVRSGDLVRVRGTVTEFKGLTELHPVVMMKVCSTRNALPAATALTLPLRSRNGLEALENMRVILPQTLTITDVWSLGQFGELVVSSQRLAQPTQVLAPGKEVATLARANERDQLIVDDGRNTRNQPVSVNGQDDVSLFSASNPIRTGQRISGLQGVLHYGFGTYRLQPTASFTIDETGNARTAAPLPVGGQVKVASFNVLNYFSTVSNAGSICGPNRNQACRGANTKSEQLQQKRKLLVAMGVIKADIFGLMELENNAAQSVEELVAGLNETAGKQSYAFIASGARGGDAIKVGLLFRPETLTPLGPFAVLDHTVDSRFDDRLNRPALAQTFRITASGELLTVVVAHLKSKSCSGASASASGPDADQGDGQACFNRTRTQAAAALADWALADPTGTGSAAVLVIGDFNSYRREDPIRGMREAGLIDLLERSGMRSAYTFVYDGLTGTLDYAFASPQLASSVTGLTIWHINADEATVLDYTEPTGKPAEYHDPG